MFDHHRKSPWFQEKYNPEPEYANLRLRVRQKGWRGRLNMFLDGLEVGQFDPDLSESQPEGESVSPAKEGASNGDDTAANGVLAMGEETKPVTGEVEEPMDDEAGDNEAAKQEANGKGPVDLGLDPRRAGRGEEVTVPNDGNQVMIRTIPPDIGRLKLEEVSDILACVFINLLIPRCSGHRENPRLRVHRARGSSTKTQLLPSGMDQVPRRCRYAHRLVRVDGAEGMGSIIRDVLSTDNTPGRLKVSSCTSRTSSSPSPTAFGSRQK